MTVVAHFPALQVVLPLLTAPLCTLLRHARLAWAAALTASWAAFAMAIVLFVEATTGGPISYAVGGWAPPWGIEIRIDAANAFVLLIVTAMGALVMAYAPRSVEREIGADRAYLFYTAFMLCLAGLIGVTITGDAFNVFVFLEVSSLSTYILVSLGRDRRALYAAYQYLILGTIGATFYLIGVGLLYQVTGTLNMADLAVRLGGQEEVRGVRAAFAFLTVGLSLKLALFPLHLWLPNAYTYAPSAVSGFLAATATKVAIYLLLRVFFTIFGHDFSFVHMPLGEIVTVLAVVAMFVASTVAIFQEDAKRMLAYSSVAQVGYIVLGIGMATVAGVQAGVLHLFNHALMKGALFLALGAVTWRLGSTDIKVLAGLGRRMPWTAAALVAGGLSLIGVPGTVGFVSKWVLIGAVLEDERWWLAGLILLSSLLAFVYVWRLVEVAYLRASPDGAPAGEAPVAMLVPVWILIAANVYFGIDTRFPLGMAGAAARALVGSGG